jgi:hypothetical protein
MTRNPDYQAHSKTLYGQALFLRLGRLSGVTRAVCTRSMLIPAKETRSRSAALEINSWLISITLAQMGLAK